jgi:hypothetical protein
MDTTIELDQTVSKIGDNALLIWWGIVMIVHPLTIGMGAIGTGLILLGVNTARLLKGIPTKRVMVVIGVIAIVWGTLDTVFNLRFEASFALMLIVIGTVSLMASLARPSGRVHLQKEE